MSLYVLAGAMGLPVYAEQGSGLDTLAGPTGGYLLGFIVAALVVGRFAERRWDRRIGTSISGYVVGAGIIYLFGVIGLMMNLGMSLSEAVLNGVLPFLVWDAVKAGAAGIAMPTAWRLAGEPPGSAPPAGRSDRRRNIGRH